MKQTVLHLSFLRDVSPILYNKESLLMHIDPLSLAICIIVFLALIGAVTWFVRSRGRARKS